MKKVKIVSIKPFAGLEAGVEKSIPEKDAEALIKKGLVELVGEKKPTAKKAQAKKAPVKKEEK